MTGSEGTPAVSLNGLGLGNGIGSSSGATLLGGGGDLSLLDGAGIVGLQQRVGGGLSVRDNEQERQRRIIGIVDNLGRKWGRVGPEGVERCAKRLGMECLWEDDGARISSSGEKTRTLSIAGNGLLVDVEFLREEVTNVVLSFPGSEEVGASAAKGAEILRRNLVGSRKGYEDLDAFAENLERLARLDQLGREGVSCFDAVGGIYRSLKRIYDWELDKIRQDGIEGLDEEKICREAQCKRSGRPKIHANGIIGLQLDYWMDRRLVPAKKRKADEMELDLSYHDTDIPTSLYRPQIYALTISCEASPASLYPSIRVSPAWVSPSVAQSLELDDLFAGPEPIIDWLEPPATYTIPPSPTNPAAISLDPAALLTGHLPNIRFIARFEPPIIVPLRTAVELYEAANSPIAQADYQSTIYVNLLLPHLQAAASLSSSSSSSFTQQASVSILKTIHAFHPGSPQLNVPNSNAQDRSDNLQSSSYRLTLFTPKDDWARAVSEIPFEHPRQLVSFLPTLRQWALLGSILRRTFTCFPSPIAPSSTDSAKGMSSSTASDSMTQPRSRSSSTSSISSTDSLTSPSLTFSLRPSVPAAPDPTSIDINLSIHPLPQLTLTSRSFSAAIDIGTNGEVEIVDMTSSGTRRKVEDEEEGEMMARFARGLAVLEDLGAWITWMGM